MEQNLDLFKDKRILITGGGGYLGSKLAEVFVQCGAKITLLDINFNHLAESMIVNNENVNKLHVDITDKIKLSAICAEVKPEYIFHFCALLNRDRDFILYDKLYNVNVNGTLNLLEALQSINYTGFYYSSSSEVYGTTNESPFHEKQVPNPASPYSLTKLMAEDLIKTFSTIHQKPFTILRIFNFIGLDMPENFFINQLLSSLKREEHFQMTGGKQIRDFIHIDQLLAAIIAISKSGISNAETINICSGNGTMLKELAVDIAQKLNRTHLLRIGALPYRENEVWEMVGANEKLKKYISFSSFIGNRTELINSLFDQDEIL